jgi:hypothetical protein
MQATYLSKLALKPSNATYIVASEGHALANRVGIVEMTRRKWMVALRQLCADP